MSAPSPQHKRRKTQINVLTPIVIGNNTHAQENSALVPTLSRKIATHSEFKKMLSTHKITSLICRLDSQGQGYTQVTQVVTNGGSQGAGHEHEYDDCKIVGSYTQVTHNKHQRHEEEERDRSKNILFRNTQQCTIRLGDDVTGTVDLVSDTAGGTALKFCQHVKIAQDDIYYKGTALSVLHDVFYDANGSIKLEITPTLLRLFDKIRIHTIEHWRTQQNVRKFVNLKVLHIQQAHCKREETQREAVIKTHKDVPAERVEEECVICNDSKHCCVILDCGHLCFCGHCALDYCKEEKEGEPRECPMCRIPIVIGVQYCFI